MSGETGEVLSGFTVDTLRIEVVQRFVQLEKLLDERYENQLREVNTAFNRQETAMLAALTAADKAVLAALAAAEKANDKAELANKDKFAATNEFREQLSDQAATFVTRNEANEASRAINEKIDLVASSLGARVDENLKAIDKIREQIAISLGSSVGEEHNQAASRANRQLIIAGIGAFLVLLGIIVTLYLATRKV